MAVLGAWIAPDDARVQNLGQVLAHPSGAHLLGTDDLGRDIASRIIVGARSALFGPLAIAIGASLLLGAPLGLLAGYRGGRIDAGIMRLVDLLYSIPVLLVALVVVGVVGGGLVVSIVLLAIFQAPGDVRVVRAACLEQRPLAYVEAARVLGLPPRRIMARHIFPVILPIVVSLAFLDFAYGLVNLSALAFLGIGAPPGSPDWGRMLAENRVYLFDTPVAALAPALMIVGTAASMNILGDVVYERLSQRGEAR